jgi:hypothetical protein
VRKIPIVIGLIVQSMLARPGHGYASEGREVPEQNDARTDEQTAAARAAAGAFLPFSQAASNDQRAHVVSLGGYESAPRTATFEAAAELTVWGPVAVRAASVYTSSDGRMRPSVGIRVQALKEERQGVDAAVGVSYRPEGLTEPEGEIESLVSVGLHAGRTYVLGNLLYGQDPEGSERDGELRLASLRPVGSLFLIGLDSRLRFDLGSNAARLAAHHEPTLDALIGPTVTALAGQCAFAVTGGASALRLEQSVSYGAFVMVSLGIVL